MIKQLNSRGPAMPENKTKTICREKSYGKLDIRPLSKEAQAEIKLAHIKEEEDKTPLSPHAFQWGGI